MNLIEKYDMALSFIFTQEEVDKIAEAKTEAKLRELLLKLLDKWSVKSVWKCPDCGFTERSWTMKDVANKGTPVCPKCDTDLEYKN